MNSRLAFVAVLLASLSSEARAGLFSIGNRNYGNSPASARASIDALFDAMEAQVNHVLPNADATTYLRGISDSSVISADGTGSDYVTQFSDWELGVSAGIGADLGGASITDLAGGKVAASRISGFAGQYSLLAGVNAGSLTKAKWGPIDPARLRLFGHFMSSNLSSGATTVKFSSWGFEGQYKLVPPHALASFGVVRWNGLDFTSGMRYTSMNLGLSDGFTAGAQGTVDSPGSPTVTMNYTGTAAASVETHTFAIPLEVSTSARAFYCLAPYVGLGADLAFGSSNGSATVNGPMTVTDSSGSLGTITGDGGLNLGQSQGPQLVDLRTFVGTQLELGVFAIFVQYNKALTNDTTGVSAGLRAFW